MQVDDLRILKFQRPRRGRGMAMWGLGETTRGRETRKESGKDMLARDNGGLNQVNVSLFNKKMDEGVK